MSEELTRAIWEHIISVNNGYGGDTDDLIRLMNEHGAPCPEDLEDDE